MLWVWDKGDKCVLWVWGKGDKCVLWVWGKGDKCVLWVWNKVTGVCCGYGIRGQVCAVGMR